MRVLGRFEAIGLAGLLLVLGCSTAQGEDATGHDLTPTDSDARCAETVKIVEGLATAVSPATAQSVAFTDIPPAPAVDIHADDTRSGKASPLSADSPIWKAAWTNERPSRDMVQAWLRNGNKSALEACKGNVQAGSIRFLPGADVERTLASARRDIWVSQEPKTTKIYFIGEPAFNKQHDRALVWTEARCAGGCNDLQFFVLKKVGSRWTMAGSFPAALS